MAEIERLLQSYEAERRPVAVANTALSIANWEETLKVRMPGSSPHRSLSSLRSYEAFALHGQIVPL